MVPTHSLIRSIHEAFNIVIVLVRMKFWNDIYFSNNLSLYS